jgi:EAL domain-containing protein (putative c-di-GMP-specific phosphodiesterase class I)
MGVRLSIDDFGTGYSSLSVLKKFPVCRLKVDRSFVQDIEVDDDDRIITRAVIALAHSLNLEVVAEGVETQGQLDYLRELHCDGVQGYLLGKPQAAEDIAPLLARSSGAANDEYEKPAEVVELFEAA